MRYGLTVAWVLAWVGAGWRVGLGDEINSMKGLGGVVVVTEGLGSHGAGWRVGLVDETNSMKGLTGVVVVAEGLGSQAEQDGLYESQLQLDVELRLRKAGIEVLSNEEGSKTPGTAWLHVAVNALKNDTGLYSYCVNVNLLQKVLLDRDHSIQMSAATWRANGFLGIVGATDLSTAVRNNVGYRVEAFCNDFLKANPVKR